MKDEELGDPLQAAASSGSVDMMLLLLEYNTSIDGFGGHFGNTLQAASFHGQEQAVRLLIEHGAAVHKTGRYRDPLQAAVYAGSENIVEILLAAGADLNPGHPCPNFACMEDWISEERIELPASRAGTGQLDCLKEMRPLEVAARRGSVALVEMLLAKGAATDRRVVQCLADEYFFRSAYTALQVAAFWGHLAVVECLLAHGADINAVRHTLGTPLQAALEAGHFDIAELLLSRGAEIDKHWTPFGSCLQVFSERGNIDAVKFLLNRGANIEDKGGENGTALQVACNAGHTDIVQYLLDSGANVRAPERKIGNALQAASREGHIDIVKLLLCQGIEVDDVDSGTETALSLAAHNGHEEMVLFLLSQGAQVDGNGRHHEDNGCKNFKKWDVRPEPPEGLVAVPLYLAAVRRHESIVSILLENGANAHLEGKLRPKKLREINFSSLYCTPLFAACYWGHTSIARRLFLHDPWGYTFHETFTSVMKTTLDRGMQEISELLVNEAVRAGFKAEHFEGAFRYACAKGHAEFVEMVLKNFGLENWPNILLHAVDKGRSAVVEVLLRYGADINFRDENGYLALDLTISKITTIRNHQWLSNRPWLPKPPCWVEVLGILLKAGADTTDLARKIMDIFPHIARRGTLDVWTALDCRQFHIFENPALFSEALISASGDRNVDKIHYLATKNVPSATTVKSAVLAAINSRRNMIPTIEALLSMNTLFSSDDDKKGIRNGSYEPLVVASGEEYTEVVAMLLQRTRPGISVVKAAFRQAIRRGRFSCAHLILDSQILNPDERLELCLLLIPECSPYGSQDMLTYLFDQGVSPNTRHRETGETLLYIAAFRGDKDGVKTLLSRGADVQLDGGEYGTALHAAAVSGASMAAELLLLAGADVDAQSARAGTPLIAVMAQKWKNTCFKARNRCLCPRDCHQCCARVLLDWDADVDANGGEFGTALRAAEEVGNQIGIKMLL